MFNGATSKFYNQLMTGWCKFLGKNPETTTEAELDGEFQALGTLEEIKEAARSEALVAVQDKITSFEDRLTGFETTLAERDATILQLTGDVTAKEQQINTLTAQVTEAQTLVNAGKAKIAQLAGEVSTLKVGKTIQHDEGGGDTDYQLNAVNKVQTVKADGVNTRFGFAN
jgi:uncharacterized coiled-coil protein SlyX